jgi:Xaa-Pro aminopeptidase
MAHESYGGEELAQFRHVQRVAYEAVEQVAAELFDGMTERQAARAIAHKLEARGVKEYFHAPFAWFGDRTRFAGFRSPLDFFPTRRALRPGMAVILDVAPAIDGYAADVGFTTAFGHNDDVATAKRNLEVFRHRILELVRAGRTLSAIYREVDELLVELGYENCHRRYPLSTLGHKVGRLPLSRLPLRPVLGFDPRTTLYLFKQLYESRRSAVREHTPIMNDRADAPVDRGLWAIEPHIGRGDVGAKWEELLLVTDSDVRWLDDDLPHVREWKAKAAAA